MVYLNSPLRLRAKIKSPSIKLEWIAFLNVLCIAFFLSLLSSKYLFAPGLNIELPKSSQNQLIGKTTAAILSVNESNLIFFEGNIYSIENIEVPLTTYISNLTNTDPILLIKASRKTEVNTLFALCTIAQKAGFSSIQLASNIDGLDNNQNKK